MTGLYILLDSVTDFGNAPQWGLHACFVLVPWELKGGYVY